MIKGYKRLEVKDTPSQSCMIYKAQKDNRYYFMYQFEDGKINESQQYNINMIKKIGGAHFSHMLSIIQEFQDQGNQYYILEYADQDLLKMQLSFNHGVCSLSNALEYMAKIFENLEELHSLRFVYRNIRPETIIIKDNQPHFYDFSLSQFMKRKQRLFQIVGCSSYLAPQFFSEDGYGKQVDIWAAGVLFFFMLFRELPFKIDETGGNFESAYKKQIQTQCSKGFNFAATIQRAKNPGSIKTNKYLQDFFFRIFDPDYTTRITISQIKKHPLFEGYFLNQLPAQMLQAIAESGNSSIFLSKLQHVPCSYQLHKQQVIVDFIQKSSEILDVDCAEIASQEVRNKTKFVILKIAMIKLKYLTDIIYGLKLPDYKMSQQEWNKVRSSTAFTFIKEKIQKKKKIIQMYYKSAYKSLGQDCKEQIFLAEIPEDFNAIKGTYRNIISSMFEVIKTGIMKNRNNRKLTRKLTQSLIRLIILHLINRIFDQDSLNQNFQLYFTWLKSTTKNLQELDTWISDEKIMNLKQFMKKVTGKYL